MPQHPLLSVPGDVEGEEFIKTPGTEPWLADPAFNKSVVDRILLGRVGEVNEVSGAVVFLASPAASMITGTTLMIDGGWTVV